MNHIITMSDVQWPELRYNLSNISAQVIDFQFYKINTPTSRISFIFFDNDFDAIAYTRDDIIGTAHIEFLELNKEGCHKNCHGCYKPQDELQCLSCTEGMRLVEGRCINKSTPCPANLKENAIGECQGCDLNHLDKVNCVSSQLSFDNE